MTRGFCLARQMWLSNSWEREWILPGKEQKKKKREWSEYHKLSSLGRPTLEVPIYFLYRNVPPVRVSFSGSSVLNQIFVS